MESWKLLLEIVLLLGGCVVLGGICSRLRQSPLIGYLLAGMLLGGPGSLHVIHSEGSIEAISELGVALLLFSLGLEFSWNQLVSMGTRTLLCGVLQVMATTLAVALIGWWLGLSGRAAIVIGGMISLSSTAAVMRVLTDRGETDSQHGRRALAILLVQDMAVVPLAILFELVSAGGGFAGMAIKVLHILTVAAALVAVLYVSLHHLAVRAFRSLSAVQNRELTVLLAVVVGLGSTWATHAAGLSPALGAFTAGLFLGGSPFASQIRADISSLRIVLLTLFFGAVGMMADGPWMIQNSWLVIATGLAIMLGKTIITAACVRIFEPSLSTALATGISLSQVGEFAFVLGGTARAAGIIEHNTYLAVISGTMLTLFLTPYLISLAALVVRKLSEPSIRHRPVPLEPSGTGPRVLLIGFGPAGHAVGRSLLGECCRVVVLDVNPDVQRAAYAFGLHGEIGDATQWDVLEHVRAHEARLIIITLPDFAAAMTVLSHCRQIAPEARVIVRSRYERNEEAFRETGAHWVVGDERQAGQALAESTAVALRSMKRDADEEPPVILATGA